MAFPVSEEHVQKAEAELGRRLPAELRERLMRDNGGEIEADGYPSDESIWSLHPVWDPGDRKRMGRTASHIVAETRKAHEGWRELIPAGSVVIARNDTGDLLLLLAERDDVVWWDHETSEVAPVTVAW